MELSQLQAHDFSRNIQRRAQLVDMIKKEHADIDGIVMLFAGFEDDCAAFRQEASFYYLTGITEPGVVAAIDLKNNTTLYIPNCGVEREKWMFSAIPLIDENASRLGLAAIQPLGQQCAGFQLHPFFPESEYDHLLAEFKKLISSGKKIFTLCPDKPYGYSAQRLLLERLKAFLPDLEKSLVDISPLLGKMRRIKDSHEIIQLHKAIEITATAHDAASQAIGDGVLECEVQAALEYMFVGSCGRAAFPSIVASGKNSTILHYLINNAVMHDGDLVVVDIGAEYGLYCADITRTYPVSGTFTPRQKEVYNLVLETQEYIASIAKPGYWLRNAEQPDKSLHHLAKQYLEERGYGQYFIHGLGHYLGLDVHDVGDYATPLEPGDVFTIEPGIYIPEEKLGVRIEDDYWVVEDGVICMSEMIPKKAEEIERMVQESFKQ